MTHKQAVDGRGGFPAVSCDAPLELIESHRDDLSLVPGSTIRIYVGRCPNCNMRVSLAREVVLPNDAETLSYVLCNTYREPQFAR